MSATIFPPQAAAALTVNLSALTENYRLFRKMTGADVAGVLKADAYGTGVIPVFKALLHEGCRRFFVATPDEAAQLRGIDKACEIMVLGGLYKGAEDFYIAHTITPVLNCGSDLERWKSAAAHAGRAPPCALHFDTGMNRLGFAATAEIDAGGLDVRLVMTHFACSDEKDHPMNEAQTKAFAEIAKRWPDAPKSLCNSSGLFRNKEWHYDIVRPGFALYGGNPTPEADNPMHAVVSLNTRVLQTRNVKKGESAGYGATHVFEKDTRTATVAIGYADGFLRSGSSKAKLYRDGIACPVVGRVSMDLVIVDIGHLPRPPQEGEWMEVLGPHQDVDALAADLGTIGYEVLTSLGARYARRYEG
ncbi:MAG: alanine racemase [Micavibrio aeruginosavorus]|uniref:Alanine racemase n=1 Tax=Micavibrio aeruginosavorus TaxID=349221 RepID=A0A2W5C3E6_9BACT|nr:MAG: alanine racemase [Micavibrio aeruginosavorus]